MKCEAFDNVWDAIEDNPATRENLKLRAELMVTLTRHIKRKGLTQSQAAKLLGVTQPRVSSLMYGTIDFFGLDLLVRIATTAGLCMSTKIENAA